MTPAERRRRARQMYRRKNRPTIREIAEELGVSVGTAHRDVNPEAAERYRRPARAARATAKRDARIAHLWAEGKTSPEIAAELDMSAVAVRAAIHRMRQRGVEVPRRRHDKQGKERTK